MHAFIGTVPFTIIEAINFVIANEIKDADAVDEGYCF